MIHNMNNNTSNEEILEMERCPYKGYTYFVPRKADAGSNVKVTDFKLALAGHAISPIKDAARLFMKKTASQSHDCLELNINGTDWENSFGNTDLTFYIYRERRDHPLAQATLNIEEYKDLHFSFPLKNNILQPGRYFLLGENVSETSDEHSFDTLNGHLCFPFMVLRAGEELMHPTLVSATASRPLASIGKEAHYTSGALRISLNFKKPRHEAIDEIVESRKNVGEEFSIICYNQDWHLMACADRFMSGGKPLKSNMLLSLHSENIWMPGTYFAVVSHNREPFALVSFHYEGDETTPCQCRLLAEGEDEYWMVKKLEPDTESRWQHVRKFQGLTQVKPRLVRLSRQNGFNRFCSLHSLEKLRTNAFSIVTSSIPFHAQRLALCLPHLLGFCTQSYRMIDCAEWVDSISEPDCSYLEKRDNYTLTLRNISALLTPNGQQLLTRIEEATKDETVFWSLILCGTRDEVEQVLARAPQLAARFPAETHFDILPPTAAEMVFLIQQQICQTSFNLAPSSEHALALQVSSLVQEMYSWKKEDIEQFVYKGIVARMKQRLNANYSPNEQPKPKDLLTIQPEDIDIASYLKSEVSSRPSADGTDIRTFDNSMAELNEMIGLHNLKDELTTTFYQVCFNEQRKRLGLPAEEDGTHHMIFTGNPGTGKTTVAGMIGKIYHSLGLLSKGEVISTERNQLVGRYIGETEEKMSALLKRAEGNVLFIDEAYTLCDSLEDRKDYGNHVIESLLTLLAKPHSDMLVILAGYADEMERLMQMNQGLKGRFPYRFHFDDYSAEELMQIATNLLNRKNYILSFEAEALLKSAVADAIIHKDRYFGNARWINQFVVSGILPAMAKRVIQSGAPMNIEAFRTIEATDVEHAIRKYVKPASPHLIPRRRIGFIA